MGRWDLPKKGLNLVNLGPQSTVCNLHHHIWSHHPVLDFHTQITRKYNIATSLSKCLFFAKCSMGHFMLYGNNWNKITSPIGQLIIPTAIALVRSSKPLGAPLVGSLPPGIVHPPTHPETNHQTTSGLNSALGRALVKQIYSPTWRKITLVSLIFY